MAKIVIIDSGIKRLHPKLKNISYTGFHFYKDENGNIREDIDVEDCLGHGTAVAGILAQQCPENTFVIIRIFEREYEADEELLLYALKYIRDHVTCDLVHMSLGLTEYTSVKELEEVCRELYIKGVTLVSAFDNFGQISFPAAFDTVIGVDSTSQIKRMNAYYAVSNSPVNLFVRKGLQRVCWIYPDYVVKEGNSFSAPYVTAMAADAINKYGLHSRNVLDFLQKKAFKHIGVQPHITDKPEVFLPSRKAVVFPFNKEVHSLVRYSDTLQFEIALYDRHEKGTIGSNVATKLAGKKILINDIRNLCWEDDFDTVILSHCGELSTLIDCDLAKEILNNCIRYHKHLFAFDDLRRYTEELVAMHREGCKVYYPCFDEGDIPVNMYGKLYYIPVPVLAVCGTSSSQGKFTLQQAIRLRMQQRGVNVGQIGTEPSSLLYGHDAVCPIGYESSISITDYNFIAAVNKLFFQTAIQGKDIIITGTQSGMVPYNYDSMKNIPLYSMEYLMGAQPDGVVLCVNAYDEIDYIRRTIQLIEGLVDTRVFALALHPLTYDIGWGEAIGAKKPLTDEKIVTFIKNAEEHFKIPVVCLKEKADYDMLFEHILTYFLSENK